jgi:hypothetical protein
MLSQTGICIIIPLSYLLLTLTTQQSVLQCAVTSVLHCYPCGHWEYFLEMKTLASKVNLLPIIKLTGFYFILEL